MSLKEQHLYEFEGFVLDTSERQLKRGEETVSLPPKAIETLCLLVENHGKLMSKDELMSELWADTFVEERNLSQNIFTLRKTLGGKAKGGKFIETVPKRGYRFVATVQPVIEEEILEISVADKTTITAEGNVSRGELAEVIRTTSESLKIDPNQIKQLDRSEKQNIVSKTSPPVILIIGILAVLSIGASYWFWSSNSADQTSLNETDSGNAMSIAVMPFVNKSNSGEIEYLSDGMTETLINSLSKISDLSVKARSSVFRYKGGTFGAKKIGRELGVKTVLFGSIIQKDKDLILNLELVEAKTENQIWGKKYERKMDDLVSLQSEIAKNVTEKLRLKVSKEAEKQLVKQNTTNPEAFQAYLKGRFFWNKRTGKDLASGIRYFKQAINIDPNYALAWSGLADSYSILPFYSKTPTKEALPKARSAAEKAIALDPDLAEAHTSLASILHSFEWDFKGAEKEYLKAIKLNPNYATAHQWYSEYLNIVGKDEKAIKEAKTARKLEPLSLVMNIDVAVAFHFARKFSESARAFERTLEIFPDYADGYYGLALALAHQQKFEAAITECNKAIELGGDYFKLCLGYVYAKSEKGEEAKKILAENLKGGEDGEYIKAMIHSLLGNKDKAFLILETLIGKRYVGVLGLKVEPGFDDLRDDPRYQEMIRQIGFPD